MMTISRAWKRWGAYGCTLVLCFGGAAVVVAEEVKPIVFKRYNLSCLAPLLENLNAEEPKTLEEAFLRGPSGMLSPILEGEGIGVDAVHFPITTTKPETQKHFNRGIALLHTMWYREAERAFRTVVQLDPECAMGYWGLAMANELEPGRARLFARTAVNKTSLNRPALEQRWIKILAEFYQVPLDGQEVGVSAAEATDSLTERSAARIGALEDLVLKYPAEVEGKAFLLRQLTLDKYRVGLPLTSHLGVEYLAKDLAEVAPHHPSRHYAVFLWLERLPERGVESAHHAGVVAPGVAEVWRFSGEGNAAAGQMQSALAHYEAAVRTDLAFMEKRACMPWQTQNLAANYRVLVETLALMGRTEEALDWCARAALLPNSLGAQSSERVELPSLARSLSLKAWAMTRQWEELLKHLQNARGFQAVGTFPDQATQLFWQGVSQLLLDRPEEAVATEEAIGSLLGSALKAGVSNEVEKTISTAITSLKRCRRLLASEKPAPMKVELEHPFLSSWVLVPLYEKAGLVRHAAALAQSEAEAHPHFLLPAARHCALAYRTENRREAFFQMNRNFRANASRADAGSPVLRGLDVVAAEMRLPTPWTLAIQPRDQVGDSGDLKALGGAGWEPSSAPPWALPDHNDEQHRLNDFAGKPVLLNFFLGVSCPFCVKQLELFKPHLPAFREAGIEFVAVSTDPVAILQRRFDKGGGLADSRGDDFPFLVLADPELSVFRSYQAYDEFEEGPLHATILLDGQGRVLWANRSHAPFEDPEALLSEARRLLGLHEEAK